MIFKLTTVAATTALGLFAPIFSGARAESDTDTITITGNIVEKCELPAAPAASSLGDLGAKTSHVITFDVNCNAPFEYALASANGALEHVVYGATPGFAHRHEYEVAVSIPTDGDTISDSCDSSEILATGATCAFTDSGSDVAIDQTATLTITWDDGPALPGAATPLIAGDYADTLTITVSVR